MLLLTAAIWGAAFVAQSVGMDYVGPFTFQFCAQSAGRRISDPLHSAAEEAGVCSHTGASGERRDLVKGGVVCGVLLGVASSLQQIGIGYTTVSKAGFITALYVVIIVPILGLFFRKKVPGLIWGCGAFCGLLHLLCMSGGASLGTGDIMVCLGALAFPSTSLPLIISRLRRTAFCSAAFSF